MAVGYKHRQWEAFVSVSASGPEFSKVFERRGYLLRSRMAADLKYTTADVDFLFQHFVGPEQDRPRVDERHFRFVNPTRAEVVDGLKQALSWLAIYRSEPDWDGGGLHFNFAGHGCEGSGDIVLSDGTFSADEFLALAGTWAAEFAPPGRLRLSVVLDSCHSGVWVTRILHSCFHERQEYLVPFNVFASCMPDEAAFEDSSLGHGLFTYCFSVRPASIGSYGAEGLMPNNEMGPSLSIAAGERGCSLVSAGAQNPVAYWNGAGQLEVAGVGFSIFGERNEPMTESEMTASLIKHRVEVREAASRARPDIQVNYEMTDADLRKALRALRQRLSDPTLPPASR